jgi:lysozyme family protein
MAPSAQMRMTFVFSLPTRSRGGFFIGKIMDLNFPSPILPFTLQYEGGKANDPRDPGGRTNYGVTQKTYDLWRVSRGLSRADVFSISAAERDSIYEMNYWKAVKGDALASGVDLCVFDDGVNAGPAAALKLLARTKSSDPVATIHAFCDARLVFLRGLRNGSLWRTFGAGWGARVGACEALALRMALPAVHASVVAKGRAVVVAQKAHKHATIAASGAGTGSLATGGNHAVGSGDLVLTIGFVLFGLGITAVFAFLAYQKMQQAQALAKGA